MRACAVEVDEITHKQAVLKSNRINFTNYIKILIEKLIFIRLDVDGITHKQEFKMTRGTMVILTHNRMWFSVVCTLIDNDTRQHSGQNVMDSRGAAE